MTDDETNETAICAKGKRLHRMKMDSKIQKETSEPGPGRWAQEQPYNRPETLISLGSHSFSSVYRTGQVGWSCPHLWGCGKETQRYVTGRFTREEITGGLHPKTLFIVHCKSRWGCPEHCREQSLPSLRANCDSAEPPLGGRRGFVLHSPPSSWWSMILVLTILWNQKTWRLWLNQGLPGFRNSWYNEGLKVRSI